MTSHMCLYQSQETAHQISFGIDICKVLIPANAKLEATRTFHNCQWKSHSSIDCLLDILCNICIRKNISPTSICVYWYFFDIIRDILSLAWTEINVCIFCSCAALKACTTKETQNRYQKWYQKRIFREKLYNINVFQE